MKKKLNLEQVMKAASPKLKKWSEGASEAVLDVAGRITQDQAEWLDQQMADLLPPLLYQAGLKGEHESLIANYIARHKIRIIFVPDRLAIRIMIGEKVHSQFIPEISIDGERMTWEQIQNPALNQN